jgi:hypothetical protein
MLSILRERELTGSKPKAFVTLKVFDYDEDGGLTSEQRYSLYNKRIMVADSLFDFLDSVLPFKEWGKLYFYEVNYSLNRQMIFEEAYHNDPDIREHMRSLLDLHYTLKIRTTPQSTCLQLHKRFP